MEKFGVALADKIDRMIKLPANVAKIILPWGEKPPKRTKAEIIWQVKTAFEAEEALAAGAKTLIIKGAEGAGFCGEESSFILFQKVLPACLEQGTAVLVQGGIGVHGAAAYLALGAAGVVLDSQVALFPECGLAQDRKTALGKLSGTEIRSCGGYRYHVPFGANEPGELSDPAELLGRLATGESEILPLGQDIVLAGDLASEYKRLKQLVRALERAASTHLKQARIRDTFAADGETAQSLGTGYPLVQGPMARISDMPGFLRSVAQGGALPILAMSMEVGETAEKMLAETAAAMGDKPWGVGILGFAFPQTLEEQTKLIIEAKPQFILIAGGRPGQGAVFEQAGIKVLLHAPSTGLLDMFLNEGSAAFIFEGRESGGHVGPLFSSVLWEKQINALLKMENITNLTAIFAGGIHDALSAAFVRVMTGPLSARDLKAGIQCGTAYLYTKEAVKEKAITKDYQKLLIEKNQTLLLKSGAGQETRCIPNPFTDYFLEEKARIESEGADSIEMIKALEALNLGRLRIAAKGMGFAEDKFIPLPPKEQQKQGLYMTGAVTALMDKTTTIADLHQNIIEGSRQMLAEITLPEYANDETAPADIAVIGMAGIFPGAENVDEFWRNTLFGTDCITEVPKDRWPVDIFFDPGAKDTDHVISKWGGFIGKSDFDALEFGITPQSISSIEPVQLLSLLVAKRALEDAGFTDLAKADLDETAVIFGAQGAGELAKEYGTRMTLMELLGEIPKEVGEIMPRLTEDSFPGVLSNVISGRISNRLNTGGHNYTVDAACATSLASLDIAVSELRSGKANMVIMGGADLHNGISDFLVFGSTYALSGKGRCATFDVDADGIAISEGIAAVILKRLEDAEADGDKIYAVIKGVGGSSDGKSLGLTAPSKRGQIMALERTYEGAGISPSQVGFLESHGTGTVVGDRTELQALNHVFAEDGTRPGRIALGSLKSSIGHTKCTAGVAGLIKAVYCVRHGVLPPTLHLKKPNKVYAPSSPFHFRTEKAGYWQEERRIAGISAFGFGGTNFHAIVENYPLERPDLVLKSWPAELFVFAGESPEEAQGLMENIGNMLGINNKLRLIDIAYSLALRAEGKPIQYALVAGSREELLTLIDKARAGGDHDFIHRLNPLPGKVAFLFTGQGSQRLNMAADLFTVFPRMRRLLADAPGYEGILFPQTVFTDAQKKAQRDEITDTRNAQPLLGIVDLAMAELLESFGIKPDLVAGHSYGELPALCYAGAIAGEDLVSLSRARAEAILNAIKADKGRMAAVFTDKETLDKLLEGEDEVWPVNFNTPRQTVVAATSAGLEAFLAKAEKAGVSCNELNVACAFHSPLLEGADQGFAKALEDLEINEPRLPVMSNTDAKNYPLAAEEIKKRLADHLVNPVRFVEEIENMSADGVNVFIEAGPGGALIKLASGILKNKESAFIHMEQSGENGITFLLQGFAKYIATGRMIKMDELFRDRDPVELNLDEPQANAKKGLIFNIDGRAAVPENGEAAAASQAALSDWFRAALAKSGDLGASLDQIMMLYLDNMNAVIQDQRDVMLGYLGAPEIAPRGEVPRRQFVTSDSPVTEVPVEVEIEEPGEEGDDLLDIASMSTEQITDMIFEIVSEKTGYPTSMLTLDTDLEADLSIDSIKKMEIVGGLRNRVKMPEGEEGMEVYFEKIISVKKFRDLTEWVEELGRAAAAGELSGGGEQEVVSAQLVNDFSDALPSKAMGITRLTYVETAFPLMEKDESLIAEKNFVLPDDGSGLAAKVAEALQALGGVARIVNLDDSPDLSGCEGIVLINSAAGTRRYAVPDLFKLLKAMDMDKLQRLFVFDDTCGSLLQSAVYEETWGRFGIPEGFSGFLKTLSHEYPGKRFCTVQFETPFDPENFADIAIDELTAVNAQYELFYRDIERCCLVPQVNPVNKDAGLPAAVLAEDSVVVVLGGTGGITPHIAQRIARDNPCHYILIDRLPPQEGNEEYKGLQSVDEVRKYLIEHEDVKNPREIEAKAKSIFKDNQIGAALERIEQAGGKVEYKWTDLTDAEAFSELLAQIKSEYGKIDAVLHAAGILEDKRFCDKEAESFARVYDVKTAPLMTVIEKLLPDLKLLVLFSSMASAFGSFGQCDYAAGNSALDNAARVLKKQYPELKVTAFNWGPWRGAGMVSDSLEMEFNRRGISLIELDLGSEFFAEELVYGNEANVVAMAIEEKAVTDLLEQFFGDDN
ncbi:MAG: SDR family NAD(P)-dependent oxidoreductase [Clostridiales bacterium]|nr:SDR family NAD(P)-dependent oxidoreductase [Clostridiales bacterium]